MKIEELTEAVSAKCDVELLAIQKVLEASFVILAEELARGEKVEVQGLGTFVRKQGKAPGKKEKTLFKSWSATGARKGRASKNGKKRKKSTRKGKKENSP